MYEVSTAYEREWSTLRNGDLLNAAELAGFDVFLTTDQNLRYEQNISDRSLAIVILSTTSWPRIKQVTCQVLAALQTARAGQFHFVEIP
ncbi:MAG: hypothetical protein AAGM45_05110 [Cyanobacteria bacterium J06588_5]